MQVEFQCPWPAIYTTIDSSPTVRITTCVCGWYLTGHPTFCERRQTHHTAAHWRGEYDGKRLWN